MVQFAVQMWSAVSAVVASLLKPVMTVSQVSVGVFAVLELVWE